MIDANSTYYYQNKSLTKNPSEKEKIIETRTLLQSLNSTFSAINIPDDLDNHAEWGRCKSCKSCKRQLNPKIRCRDSFTLEKVDNSVILVHEGTNYTEDEFCIEFEKDGDGFLHRAEICLRSSEEHSPR